MPEKNPSLFDLLLDASCPWEALHDEHKVLAIDILARLLANATLRNHDHDQEKDHE